MPEGRSRRGPTGSAVDRVARNRARTTRSPKLRKIKDGYQYGGTPSGEKDLPTKLRTATTPADPIAARKQSLQAMLYDYFNSKEGGLVSVSTWDGTFTMLSGMSSVGLLHEVIANAAATSPASAAMLSEIGFSVVGGKYVAIDTSSRTLVWGKAAIEVVKSDTGILTRVLEVAENPEAQGSWVDASYDVLLKTTLDIPEAMTTNPAWTDARVRMAAHLCHWTGTGLAALAAVGPEPMAMARWIARKAGPGEKDGVVRVWPANTASFIYVLTHAQAGGPTEFTFEKIGVARAELTTHTDCILLPRDTPEGSPVLNFWEVRSAAAP